MIEAEYSLTDGAFSAQRGETSAGDEQLLVKFYYETVEDRKRTEEEGRPMFKEVAFIDIRQPGNRDWGVVAPANQMYVDRFPEHYRRFLARQTDEAFEGTPLSQWPGIARPQVEELKFFNCHSVEQLAGMSDANTGQFLGLIELKQKAKAYLESAKINATAEALAAAKARNEELEARLAKLEAMLGEPDAPNDIDAVTVPAPRRRGRPPRED